MSSTQNNKKPKQKAGVVVYRKNENGQTEYLIITSRKFPGTWVFPAGTVEEGETLQQAAARECAEESGYIVLVGEEIKTIEIEQNNKISHFTFYLATVTGETDDYEKDRKRKWVSSLELPHVAAEIFSEVAIKAIQIID